nr:MAG TPA: hypothetical protein [Caudoviricetes sp.]
MRNIKIWYIALTRGGEEFYSLSDTQFFWITLFWVLLLPFVAYAVFFIAKATWKELAVYVALEIAVLAFKYAKYIKVKYASTEVELTQGRENKDEIL